MTEKTKRQKQATIIRVMRRIHRITGISLFVFFFILGCTGILLGWKKNSNGIILAKTYQGTSTDLKDWISMDSLYKNAIFYLKTEVSEELSNKVERMEIRADKGCVKFTFEGHFWGLQLDGATGNLLAVERRNADWIEKLHDGSLLDLYLGSSAQIFKLFYTSIMGLALITFTISGFWLWYGPKRMRK